MANYNPNLVKINRSYSVNDVSVLLDVSKATVRRWIAFGLPAITDMRPILILGYDLKEYLKQNRAKNKKRLSPTEMFCCRCRAPKRPALHLVTYLPNNEENGRLIGLCPTCETKMNKFSSLTAAKALQAEFEVQFTKS